VRACNDALRSRRSGSSRPWWLAGRWGLVASSVVEEARRVIWGRMREEKTVAIRAEASRRVVMFGRGAFVMLGRGAFVVVVVEVVKGSNKHYKY
jgi:hypothetical protein